MAYTAAVRKHRGAWQLRQTGTTAREAKRALAKAIGLPVRWADALPVGRTKVDVRGWGQVEVRYG